MVLASDTSRAMLATVGAPYASLRLEAPLDDADPATWQGPERHDGSRFRWTRTDRVVWTGLLPAVAPLRVRLAVPFVNQIQDDFAASCTLEVAGTILTPRVEAHALVAETTLETPTASEIVLHTPQPVTPRALRGAADDRPLGLAVGAYPWVSPSAA
jgi:hypothetical protein